MEIVLFIAVLVALVGVVVGAVVGWIPVRGAAAPERTHAHEPLPREHVDADAVRDLHFDQALRGYRPEQVDAALDDLGRELTERDAVIRELHVAVRELETRLREHEVSGVGSTGSHDGPGEAG